MEKKPNNKPEKKRERENLFKGEPLEYEIVEFVAV